MRFLEVSLVLLVCFLPPMACASVPGQIAPRGGFVPLNHAPNNAKIEGMKLPSRGARFLPLPQSGHVQMHTVEVPRLNHENLPAEVAKSNVNTHRKALSAEDAKLLLSIFYAGD